MSTRVWQCDTCKGTDKRIEPWECPGCKKETCGQCFDRFAHCKPCSEGKTDVELKLAANAEEWDFE